MRIRFWGTRGSVPSPGPSTVRYGGNTSCVEVRTDGGTLLVLDCGTGARPLGRALVQEAEVSHGPPPAGAILIGHTHWDHIHGLPFFAPLFVPGSRWDIFGPRGLVRALDGVLAGQMEYQYFPVGLDEVKADVRYHDLVEGAFEFGDAIIRTQYLNHPALTLGYRIEADGAAVVYASDHEPFDAATAFGNSPQPASLDDQHVTFLRGADVVVHDTQYEASGYAAKAGWGHSTLEYAVTVAGLAGARQLVLFHHDPERSDDDVDGLLTRARSLAASRSTLLEVAAAAEGHVMDVRGRSPEFRAPIAQHRVALATAAPAVESLAVAVALATSDPALDAAVRAAAGAEGLLVRPIGSDVADAVVVVDVDDDDRCEIPVGGCVGVLAVTRRSAPAPARFAITDWLVWPASIAHMRTKLRAVVLRRACRWMAAPTPPDEEKRLSALHALGVLDTPREDRFDRIVERAREVTGTPIALVTLVDADRQWFKAAAGIPATASHRDESLCAHAILSPDGLQVPDALLDDRFAESPVVAGSSRLRFYAGVPLALDDGSRVGTLCVADHRPRLLDGHQLEELRRLAASVVSELQAVAGSG